ncbi:ATP-binding cassette domain-containing protein [Candidatus Babeliales bacterium]|nr:ATP-binding cassette domain-containing protein [Candidatus Babeliales bacterium]
MSLALSVVCLSQTLSKKQILQNISFAAQSGLVTVLLGPNGAGKTTLLTTIMGLNPAPAADQKNQKNIISLNHEIINGWRIDQRVNRGLIYLPQSSSLFQDMSVHDNLQLVFEYHAFWHKKTKQVFFAERNMWLERTQLTHSLQQKAGVLSGGQKRKLEVVRALLMHPELILLDEPFAGVDPKSIYELKKIFTDMAQSGIGIVLSDHHVDQLLSIADLVYVVMQGHVVTSGTIKEILANKDTQERYLGDQFYSEIAERFL